MSYSWKETQEERKRHRVVRRLEAYTSVMQRTDRILSGKLVHASLADGTRFGAGGAPAWSTGSDIFFDKDTMFELYERYEHDPVKFLLKFKGANYHELCHVLYTPRRQDEIVKWIESMDYIDISTYRQAFNFLEDARIEMLFVSNYTASIRYFEAAVYEWVMRNPAALDKAHLLTTGRLYLSVEFRRNVRDAFVSTFGEPLAAEVDDILATYLKLVYPTNLMAAKKCITRMAQVLTSVYGNQPGAGLPQSGPGQCVHVVHVTADSGRATATDQKKAQAKMDEYDWNVEDTDDGSAEGGDATSDSSKSSEGKDSSSKPTKGDRGTSAGEEHAASQGKPGSGVTNTGGETNAVFDNITEMIDKAAREAMQDVLNDQDLKQDVKNIQKAVNAIIGDETPSGSLDQHVMSKPPAKAARVATRLKTVLRQIQLDLEPTWHKRENTGRINMRRVALAASHETDVFDLWDEGREDEGGVELVLCVDMSGSMSGMMKDLSAILWLLKRVLDDLGFRTTVIGFSDSYYVLYRPTDRPPRAQMPVFGAHSATNPTPALREAWRLLKNSHQNNKVLITLTDGQWGYTEEAHNIVRSLNDMGAHTMLLGLGRAVENYGKHYHHESFDLDTLDQLPKAVEQLVARIIRSVSMY